MSSSPAKEPRSEQPDGGERGVLASLPSTRPQRPSARRTAARRTARTRAEQSPGTGAKRAARARSAPSGRPAPKRHRPPVPSQGFETEGVIEPGVPVEPPSGPELAASVVELLGEFAQAGLSTGGRLLRDAFARLPGL